MCDFNLSCETTPSSDPPPSPLPSLSGLPGHGVSLESLRACLSAVMGHLKSVSTLPNCLFTLPHRNCVKSSAGRQARGGTGQLPYQKENLLQLPKAAPFSLFSAVSKSSAHIRHLCNTYKMLFGARNEKLQGENQSLLLLLDRNLKTPPLAP